MNRINKLLSMNCPLIVMAIIAIVNTPPVDAALISPAVKYDIEREQKERLQSLRDAQNEIKAFTPAPVLQSLSDKQDSNCFDIELVSFSGNTIFTEPQLLSLLNFKPSCLGLNSINNILKIITNHYVEKGYVTSRAFLTPQDLTSGILNVVIIEGKLEALLFNGQDRLSLFAAFPFMEGEVLNLRDIEQGLDQINRLARYNAQIKILPGTVQGFSIVDVQSTEGRILSGGIGFNNGGQIATGETQLSTYLSVYNVIGLLDNWSLSGGKSSEFATTFDSENVNLSVGIPLGYWNVNYRTFYSSYLSNFEYNGFVYDSSGQTNNHNLDAQWLFNRDSMSKSTVTFAFNHQRSKNFILGSLLKNSSRNLSAVSVSIDHNTRLAKGFLTVNPLYVKGVDWLNSEGDSGKHSLTPQAEFDKVTLTMSYHYPLFPSLTYNGTLYGQWSNDTLYGNQRLSIGGEYSIRGFKETSISGDQGYYWRNDMTYSMTTVPWLGMLSTQLALDAGRIAKDEYDLFEKGSLIGTSLALRSRTQNVSTSLSIGAPLHAPSRITADNYVVYYRVDLAI